MQFATIAERKSIARELLGEYAEANVNLFSAYFKLYDSLTNPQHTVVQIYPPTLTSHDDVWKLALKLRANPQTTRKEFSDQAFPSASADPSTIVDKEHAINIAVHLTLMIDCADKDRHGNGYEVGGFMPVSWRDSERLADFVKRVFPMDVHDQEKVRAAVKEKNALKSWKLKKRAHVKFRPTDNLAEHLLYDPRDNVVRVFHQTALLKTHLRLSNSVPIDCGVAECLKMGTLPPQLILETLHSFQVILFPSIDEKSSLLLEHLARDAELGFDPDCLVHGGYPRSVPENFEYHYWGNRVAKLHYVITHPMPSYRISQWVQRHALERNVLFVAILSLVLSAFFGFLSFIAAVFQSWVAYQSWKYPSNTQSQS